MKCGRNFFSKAEYDAHLPCDGKRETVKEEVKEKPRKKPSRPPKTPEIADETENVETGETDDGTINDG